MGSKCLKLESSAAVLALVYGERKVAAYLVGGGDELVTGDVGDLVGNSDIETRLCVKTLRNQHTHLCL